VADSDTRRDAGESSPPSYRRQWPRGALVTSCSYFLTDTSNPGSVRYLQGNALSINVSSGGMLLLVGHPAQERQILEIRVPTPAGTTIPTLAEVRWSKSIPVEEGESLWLAGVRFLFASARP
jgi:hypothetical protein